jgi:energy-coupling factor transport system ATP-binding protein
MMRAKGICVSASDGVRTNGLEVTYRDADRPALRQLSLEVKQGDLLLVMGASGAGKSTLIKSLARIVPCFQAAALRGEIALCGQSIREQTVRDLAGTVGLIFQDFEAQLFSTNVLREVAFAMEQLGVPPAEMPARAEAALTAVGLSGFSGRDPSTLSGGEKQRLALAGLVALDPAILLLDEPTTDLDPAGKTEVIGMLGALRRRGRTVVVVEHDIAAAAAADHILLLRNGEAVAFGTPRELLPQVALFEASGVRPHDMARLFDLLRLAPRHWGGWLDGLPGGRAHDEAHQALAAAGFAASPDSGAHADALNGPRVGGVQLEVRNASFEYQKGARALDDVSLVLRAGEFVALIGQNGSGKTTLAKLLNGLISPMAGSVLLDGLDLREIPVHRMAAGVGFVFQDPDHQLFTASAEEEVAFGPSNLGLPAAEVERRVQEALDAVGLMHRRDADPFLLNKGERQRLAVASVLSMHPSVLVLDEPTTGLDYREQRAMMELLRRQNAKGVSVIVITHSSWVVAEYASRAVLMAGGRILWDGPLRRLFEKPDVLARAAFCVPDVTALGHRFGVTELSVEALASRLRAARPG